MRAIAAAILGPLAYPECRRSAGRGWIILVRGLSGGAAAVIALCLLWWWWFNQDLDPGRLYLPYATLRVGLVALEITAVAIALVMSPAVLAGSLAGDKERGSLGLLLTTRVNALEIVLGRLTGKLCQVGQILLAGVPFLILIAALAAIRRRRWRRCSPCRRPSPSASAGSPWPPRRPRDAGATPCWRSTCWCSCSCSARCWATSCPRPSMRGSSGCPPSRRSSR